VLDVVRRESGARFQVKADRALLAITENLGEEAGRPAICKVGWLSVNLEWRRRGDVPWKEYPTSSPFDQTPDRSVYTHDRRTIILTSSLRVRSMVLFFSVRPTVQLRKQLTWKMNS
jgi:hypothetical protein